MEEVVSSKLCEKYEREIIYYPYSFTVFRINAKCKLSSFAIFLQTENLLSERLLCEYSGDTLTCFICLINNIWY